MRVLHLHTNPGWGGGEAQLLMLFAGQLRQGIAARLWTPGDGRLHAAAAAAGLPVEAFTASARQRHGLGLAPARARLQADGRPDLLHAHDSGALDLALALNSRGRLPVILSRRIASPLRRNPWSRRKYAPTRLAGVIAISQTVANVMAACGYPRDRLFVAPSAIDVTALAAVAPATDLPAAPAGGFRVGGLGKLAPKKNWELLIRCAAAWPDTAPPVVWIIAGDGPRRAELERLANTLGVSERVRFLGFRADGAGVLRALDVLFFPSRMEGASVTVREAMAMGVPVVAANAPALVESLAGCGWTVDPDDVSGAVQALRAMLEDRAERERRVLAAQAHACAAFTPERMLTATEAAYRAVLAGVAAGA